MLFRSAPTVNISDGVVKMGLLLDMISDVAASATALAAAEVARQKNKVIIMSGPGTSRLTNENCSPVSVHYAWDTYALSAVTGRGVVKGGGDSWFFITADYAFGHSLEKDASDITAKVMAWMKANPINDMFVKNGRIREDGRMMREM